MISNRIFDRYNKPYTTFDNDAGIRPIDVIEGLVAQAYVIASGMTGDYCWLSEAKRDPHDRLKALELEYICNINSFDPQAIFDMTQDIPEMNIQIDRNGRRIGVEPIDKWGNTVFAADELMKMYIETVEANKRFTNKGGD